MGMALNAEEKPLSVAVLDGEVVMTGPRVAIALRPFAAAETARRLAEAAEIALQQAGADGDGAVGPGDPVTQPPGGSANDR